MKKTIVACSIFCALAASSMGFAAHKPMTYRCQGPGTDLFYSPSSGFIRVTLENNTVKGLDPKVIPGSNGSKVVEVYDPDHENGYPEPGATIYRLSLPYVDVASPYEPSYFRTEMQWGQQDSSWSKVNLDCEASIEDF